MGIYWLGKGNLFEVDGLFILKKIEKEDSAKFQHSVAKKGRNCHYTKKFIWNIYEREYEYFEKYWYTFYHFCSIKHCIFVLNSLLETVFLSCDMIQADTFLHCHRKKKDNI